VSAQSDDPLRPGDRVDLEIEKLIAGGEALARHGGMVVFLRGAYPGDHVRCRIDQVKRSFARGTMIELLRASPFRRTTPCPVADECGGCDWTALRLDAQLRAKRAILLESLRRTGKLDLAAIPELRLHASPLNYRLRSRLHTSSSGEIGFFRMRSHEVVPLPPECEVVGPKLLERAGGTGAPFSPSREITFVENEVELLSSESNASEDTLSIETRGFSWRVSAPAFFQVNRHRLGLLIDLVSGHAANLPRREVALDLYGGVGFFASPLARLFASVTSIESDAESHRLAVLNCSGGNVELLHRDVLEHLHGEERDVDMILLDPPRGGTHPEVIRQVDRLSPRVVSYLSCDPVNLARDLARFAGTGWRLESIDLIDLFPNTHHIETLVSLKR
jgi:tRNA/tmRNA/rRNA uracil-C5-methylase (TrmA/RlmC/RlmD family)